MSGREKREAWEAVAFLSPWIIGFVLFTAGPIVASFVLSFFRWDGISPPAFIGLANFKQLLRDETLRLSLYNTALYAAMYIPAEPNPISALRPWPSSAQANTVAPSSMKSPHANGPGGKSANGAAATIPGSG